MKIVLIHLTALTIFFGQKFLALKTASPNSKNMFVDTVRQPKMSLEETTIDPFSVLAINDTAVTIADISKVLSRGYGELFTFTGKNSLVPARIMAFYYSYHPPIGMDVAVEVSKIPVSLQGRIYGKTISGGKVIIAHYQGPYEQVEIAYAAIANKLKEQNKEAGGPPFEVYLNNPGTVKDPYELRTDVYQLYK